MLFVVLFCLASTFSALFFESEQVPQMVLSATYDAERPISAAGTSFAVCKELEGASEERDVDEEEDKLDCNDND